MLTLLNQPFLLSCKIYFIKYAIGYLDWKMYRAHFSPPCKNRTKVVKVINEIFKPFKLLEKLKIMEFLV